MSGKNFHYREEEYRYVMKYRNGEWKPGYLSKDASIVLNESACVFQYAQTCFEGLKAYRTKDDHIVCFRPDMNAKRMIESCKRMVMPIIPVETFIQAIDETVLANEKAIPDYESGGSLYIRPFMFGSSPVLGVMPSEEFEFRVFVSPVGSYFDGQAKGLSLRISDYDRAAPNGTGYIKAGINYAMSLYPLQIAHDEGYDENLYLDSKERIYIEETGGANIFFVTADHKIIVPASASILPSISRKSIIELAKNYLNLEVIERKVRLEEIRDFQECGLCGTAAVIAPVASITNREEILNFNTSDEGYGPICKQLREMLLKIQHCEIQGPEGWIHIIR